MEVVKGQENRFRKNAEGSEGIDLARERKAHEFRWGKWTDFPQIRATLSVVRNDPDLWERVQPSTADQRKLEEDMAFPGETHRVGAALFANIYRNPSAAALYDVALYEATQVESDFSKRKIDAGVNYSPLTIVGIGGVYGTILSAAILKENPDNPAFGFDASRRRGGIWGVSGDLTLDKAWWRMNSKNRPDGRGRSPLPGGDGNQNTLGVDTQNLQGPDISSAQYLTNNEFGRVVTHDNFNSNNLVVNSRLVKVRPNRKEGQNGEYEQEYEDTQTGVRFFAYTDVVVQASGLGKEKLGFSDQTDFSREAIEEAAKDLREGVKTPRLLTFLQLVEVTTANREIPPEDFKKFGIVGQGDTNRVTQEHFGGIGGIDPGVSAQIGFVEEVVEFGRKRTREELARSERARYASRITEFERKDGESFARFRGIEARVVGVGVPVEGDKLVVFLRRFDKTPGQPTATIGSIDLPRLITAAGFEDEANKIYSGLTAEVVEKDQVAQKLAEGIKKPGSTIFYDPNSQVVTQQGFVRADVEGFAEDANMVIVTLVDREGKTVQKMLSTDSLTSDEYSLLDPTHIDKLEIAGEPPKFVPFYDKDFDEEIPVAEKAEGFEIYKAGACTDLPITDKERENKAFDKVMENTKSIFRYSERTVAFGKSLGRRIQAREGALNQTRFKAGEVNLSGFEEDRVKDGVVIQVDPKANAQKLSANLKTDNLLKYLALSKLNCIFPKGIDDITFGVKRVAASDEKSPFALAVQFGKALPDNPDWYLLDRFLSDPLMQRLLIRLTKDSTKSAEVKIGIREGRVDIRKTSAEAVKNDEISQFNQKYSNLGEKT